MQLMVDHMLLTVVITDIQGGPENILHQR